MAEPASIAIESARRAARAGLLGCANVHQQTHALATLHHTLSDEAKAAGADLVTRIDALTRAIAALIYDAHAAHPDAARLLAKNAGALTASQLNTLLAVLPPLPSIGAQS